MNYLKFHDLKKHGKILKLFGFEKNSKFIAKTLIKKEDLENVKILFKEYLYNIKLSKITNQKHYKAFLFGIKPCDNSDIIEYCLIMEKYDFNIGLFTENLIFKAK